MIKHNLNKVFTLFAVVFVTVAHFLFGLSLWYIPVILLISVSLVLYGILNLDFNYFFISLYQGKTINKQIALTFDDGPHKHTLKLLKVLKEKNVKASFFCIGKHVENHPEIVKKIYADNHILGNHSFYHGDTFSFQSTEKITKELKETNDLIFKLIGIKPKLFRAPYGVSNPMIGEAIQKMGFLSIGWSVRSFDTFFSDEDAIFNRISKQIKPGSIVLMHDNLAKTSSLVSKLITYCAKNQYEIVPLSALLEIDSYE
jgi:peptidoglycan/xylan/chitin deacetylase (PgdA/CDA1 family)